MNTTALLDTVRSDHETRLDEASEFTTQGKLLGRLGVLLAGSGWIATAVLIWKVLNP